MSRSTVRVMRARPAAPTLLGPPTPRGSFVGRQAELRELAARFYGGARLVTLTGPGGIGKTRLALEHAAAQKERTAFADLASARAYDDVVRIVARALGVALQAGGDPAAVVMHALATTSAALLILDNAERVVAEVAGLAAGWAEAAHAPRLLVTSRERLRVIAESTLEVGALPTSSDGDEPSVAARLFLDRMHHASATADDRSAVEECVRMLGGVPLAIELAASRANLLPPAALLERLSASAISVLGHAGRDAQPRHATMRRVIDDSWALLSPRERRVLAQLSVFEGGSSLEDAEAVLDAGGDDVLDALQGLRDKSLILLRDEADGPRIELLSTVKSYAADQLEAAGDAAETRQRHAEHYVRAGRMRVGDPAPSLTWLAREHDNLVAIVERASAGALPRPGQLEIEALLVLDPLISRQGPVATHARRLDAALARAGAMSDAQRGAALVARAQALGRLGRFEQAIEDVEAALELLPPTSDVERTQALWIGGAVLSELGRFAEARTLLTAARDWFRSRGQARAEARVLQTLAQAQEPHDFQRAHEHAHQAAALAAASGDGIAENLARQTIAFQALNHGELAIAREAAAAFRELTAQADLSPELRPSNYCLALLALAEGRHADAAAELARIVEREHARGYTFFESEGRRWLAIIRLQLGQLAEAHGELRQALAVLAEGRRAVLARGWLAAVCAARGELDEASTLLRDAQRQAGRIDAAGAGIIRLMGAHVALAASRRAAMAGDPTGAHAAEEEARALLEHARHAPIAGAGTPPVIAVSFEAVQAVRTLEPLLPGATPALRVHADGRWLDLPDGQRNKIGRKAVRRVLVRLVRARLSAPGEPLSAAELIAAGWPDERIQPAAAKNRLHVALSLLRGLGLREALSSSEDGYFLDPRVEVVMAPETIPPDASA